jgi:hypothetical protein
VKSGKRKALDTTSRVLAQLEGDHDRRESRITFCFISPHSSITHFHFVNRWGIMNKHQVLKSLEMRTRFGYLTRISDVEPVRRAVALVATFSLCFTLLIHLCHDKKGKERQFHRLPHRFTSASQWFPLEVPTVIFEVWLFNPRIDNFSGRIKGDIVTEQCVEKSDVRFQRSPI